MDPEEHEAEEKLISRAPQLTDLSERCADLNKRGATYIVIGGLAIISSGHTRTTMDLDFVVDPSEANVTKVYKALETLPDKAVLELEPHEVTEYTVVRVGDEIKS